MRILVLSDDFLPDSDVVGGATVATRNLAQALVDLGHQLFVITASREKEKSGLHMWEGVTVHRLFSPYYHERWRAYRSVYNPAVTQDMERLISEIKPDIVLANTIHLYLSYYALLIAKRHARVFFVAHDIMSFYPGTFTEFINPKDLSCPKKFNYRVTVGMMLRKFKLRYNPVRNICIRYILGKIDGIIAVSEALKDALEQNGIKNISVIHNGIDASRWLVLESELDEFKKTHGLERANIVLFGGRLSGAKGGEIILRAMQKVKERVPTAVLCVAGKKDFYAERMEEKTKELRISDAVIFTGWLNETEMKRAYAAASVVVTPSVCFDSFPNTNLEAFAAGKPAVATCFGGSREVVIDGENGYIVNPFDGDRLVNSIANLLLHSEKAVEFGIRGKEHVREKFALDRVAQKYLDLFSK